MTFNPVAAINVLECRNIISEKNPNALDLGSQTSSIDNIFPVNLDFNGFLSKTIENCHTGLKKNGYLLF